MQRPMSVVWPVRSPGEGQLAVAALQVAPLGCSYSTAVSWVDMTHISDTFGCCIVSAGHSVVAGMRLENMYVTDRLIAGAGGAGR